LILASLVIASLAGASSPFKRYTLPAAPLGQVASPGTLTVLFPSEWRVSTKWQWGKASPSADDPVHTTVHWSVEAQLVEKDTTLADLLHNTPHVWRGWVDVGWGTKVRTAGNTYLTLPIGKVWRLTQLIHPNKERGGWAARFYLRQYWLDRGVARKTTTGEEKELFLIFTTSCGIDECRIHNGQLATIMRSLQLTP
jgi:hypothetical protein